MRFSERQGFKNYDDFIQTESMNESLRNSIWNKIVVTYYYSTNNYITDCVKIIALFFRKTTLDELPYIDDGIFKWLKKYFFELAWYEVYDLLEFLVSYHTIIIRNSYSNLNQAQKKVWNLVFEQENSGFRFFMG